MRQLPLSYEPSTAGRAGWFVTLEALRAAVAHLGTKEVIYELNVQKSTFSEALGEREERKAGDARWAAEWTYVVLAMLEKRHTDTCDQLARAILESIAAMSSRFVIADASDEPTPEEIAAAERVLAKAKGRRRAA